MPYLPPFLEVVALPLSSVPPASLFIPVSPIVACVRVTWISSTKLQVAAFSPGLYEREGFSWRFASCVALPFSSGTAGHPSSMALLACVRMEYVFVVVTLRSVDDLSGRQGFISRSSLFLPPVLNSLGVCLCGVREVILFLFDAFLPERVCSEVVYRSRAFSRQSVPRTVRR